ncbi:MAG TPA: AMP-binding protein, partial [Paracoccus sp. (in: a-proteobacteria)]|nr:AMP-binding protein [Paracoccus sp. (in: a-proteobacteria)]
MTVTTSTRARPGYDDAVARFSIQDAMAGLRGDLQTGLNACVECCDRHVGANRVALRCLSPDEELSEYTFEDLRDLAARAANVFHAQGIRPGDVIAGLLPRTVELVATVLGAWRLGAVYQPLFTAFGPKAIEHRLATSGAKLVVTNTAQRPKLDEIADCPPVAVV